MPISTTHQEPLTPVLSIVIPVYNEPDLWRKLLQCVEAVDMGDVGREIIIVEDGSNDGTTEQIRRFADNLGPQPDRPGAGGFSYRVIFHEKNRGKGAALRTGFAAACGDVVVVQDADLEYDPADFARLAEPILEDRADVVYGTRFGPGRGRKGYLANYLANRMLTWLSNLTTGLKLTDMETCYKMFRREVLLRLTLEQDRFGFEPEVTAALARLDVRIAELPIRYQGRSRSEGKKIGIKDGLQAIRCIFRYGRRGKRRASMVKISPPGRR